MTHRSRARATAFLLLFPLLLSGCGAVLQPLAGPQPGRGLAPALDAIFADTALDHAHWGVFVRSLDTDRVLYQRNADRLFIPASNVKLLTGSAALEALGPEYRYRTRLLAAGPVRNGVLQGDLIVIGSGDPTISARFHGGEARAVFRMWADSLRAAGIRRVSGAIVGIDTVFARVPWGPGWAWDDLNAAYAAEISGLNFNEGAVAVRVFAGDAVGRPGILSVEPAAGHLTVVNETHTVAAGTPAQLQLLRDPAGPSLIVRGAVPLDTASISRSVAVPHITQFFLTSLRETLREQGIMVEGPPLDGLEWPERVAEAARATPLFVHHSPPMHEIVPAFMKPSQNHVAEALLRTLGREARNAGTTAGGVAVVDSVLTLYQLGDRPFRMADGSGLARQNLTSPRFVADLLTVMARGPFAEQWVAAQPIAGVDGTLASRLRGTPAEGRVQAKTGTLTGVRALSGYLTTASGERIVFSILVNNHVRTAAAADRIIDAALLRLIEEPRR
jgi:serine-type D-Ala-D-Ala carboxypeptidase/endopeptidase (penicillin-binding protein 4)